MSDEVCYWYVEPLDSHTNMVIGLQLSGDVAERVRDEKGDEKEVWACPDYEFVSKLRRSQSDLKIAFRVYTRRGSGPLRPATFLKPLRDRLRNLRRSLRPSTLGV
ncbi:MAG: hypothetical protein KGZ30_01070 [Anaplasmataceae bacterium]|nr:hypothetical protein [Anaplasmataceae bacterium]